MTDLAALLDKAMPATNDISIVKDRDGRGWQANVRRGVTGNSYNVQIMKSPSRALEAALRAILGMPRMDADVEPEPEPEDDWSHLV